MSTREGDSCWSYIALRTGDSAGSKWVGIGPSFIPFGAKSQPFPSACIMNGSSPASAAGPTLSWSVLLEGARSTGKSGTSRPVHRPWSSSHHTSFLRSDQGLPSRSADARLYNIRLLAGYAQAHWLDI